MTLTLAQYESRVDTLIQADAGLVLPDGIDDAIRRALETYSDDLPRELVEDNTDADGSIYDFDLPASFVVGQSRIVSIEWPAGERVPVYLDADEWGYYRTASTTKLRFRNSTPQTGDTIRITYTAAHTIENLDGAAATTIPGYHVEIFAKLAAAEALELYAARYLHEQESTLGADTVDRASKTDLARRLANAWRGQYEDEIGKRRGTTAAFGRIDWDSTVARSGVRLLTHGRRGY